jgi:hypothetical protein
MRFLRIAFLRRYLRMNAIQKGLFGGSRPWQAVLLAGLVLRQLNKVLKRGAAPVVLSEKLDVGQAMIIRHLPPEPNQKKQRRAG